MRTSGDLAHAAKGDIMGLGGPLLSSVVDGGFGGCLRIEQDCLG
jgi:hypothetical protein